MKIYVYASERSERGRKFWHFYILKVLFLSIFCRYFRYFVGTNDMLLAFWGALLHTKSAISFNILSVLQIFCRYIKLYESVLGGLLEKHAPLLTHTIRCRPNSPWYNDELRQAKKELRRLERTTFSRSGGCLEIHRQIFEKKRQQYKRAIASSKIKYHRDQLSNCNARELFRKVDKLSRPQSLKQLPDNSGSSLSLPERFQQFFVNKSQDYHRFTTVRV